MGSRLVGSALRACRRIVGWITGYTETPITVHGSWRFFSLCASRSEKLHLYRRTPNRSFQLRTRGLLVRNDKFTSRVFRPYTLLSSHHPRTIMARTDAPHLWHETRAL